MLREPVVSRSFGITAFLLPVFSQTKYILNYFLKISRNFLVDSYWVPILSHEDRRIEQTQSALKRKEILTRTTT